MEPTTILVVEDDADIRESLESVLEVAGYNVVTARHGKDALDKLDHMDPPSLILLDLMMPVMSGPEFLDVIQGEDRYRDVPVVVVSAYGELADSTCGIAGFLKKPVDVDVLLRSVEELRH